MGNFLIGVAMSFTYYSGNFLFLLMWLILSAARIWILIDALFPRHLVLVLFAPAAPEFLYFLGKNCRGSFLFAIMFINAAGFYYAPYLRSHSFSTDCISYWFIGRLLLRKRDCHQRWCINYFSSLGVGLRLLLGIFHSDYLKTFSFLLH